MSVTTDGTGHVARRSSRRPLIYVVDDEHLITYTLCAILNGAGYEAVPFPNAEEAFAQLPYQVPDLVISDVMLDGMAGLTGIDLQKMLADAAPEIPVLLMSGHSATPMLVENARKRGEWVAVYGKPLPPEKLLKIVAKLLDRGNAAT